MPTFTSDAALSLNAYRPPTGGIVGVREAVYTTTAAALLADVYQMAPVAKGERVVGGELIVETDMDTNGTPLITLNVGDGVDADRYISGSTIGRTGGVERFGFGIDTAAEAASYNYRYPAADTVDITVAAAPATGVVACTIRLRLFIVAA